MRNMKNEVEKIENPEQIQWKLMIDDVEKYMTNREDYCTMQQVLGHDMIFRGFIVKDWFGKNVNAHKYGKHNKAITKLCVQYYWMCWKERNEIMNKKEIKSKNVLEWFDGEVEKAKIHKSKNVRRYVREYATAVRSQATDHMQRWLIDLNNVTKREKLHEIDNIRRYMR